MKNISIIYSAILFITVLFQSCNKDLGNYNYTELSEITIEGIDSSYTAFNQRELKINPKITLSDNTTFNSEDFSFEWFTMNTSSSALNADIKKDLGTNINLDTTITLPPGLYKLYYRIKNKKTNYQFTKTADLTVTSELADGWLVLNDIEGQAHLDMLSYQLAEMKYVRYKNIMEVYGGLKLKGKPKLVYYLYNRDIFNNKYSNRIYVGTDQETFSINNEARTWTDYRNLKTEVMRPTPANYHAEVIRSQGSSTLSYILDNENILMHENVTQAAMYGPTLNRLSTGSRLNISKYMADYSGNFNAFLVVFDTDNLRFLVLNGTNPALLIPSSSDPDKFSPDNMKMDLLYMERALTATNQFYAILKSKTTNEIKLLRFVHNGTVFSPLEFEIVNQSSQLDQAEFYAVDPNFGYIIYTIGNKVFQYNPFSKSYTQILDLGSRKISLLKFQKLVYNKNNTRYKEFAKKMMICTYDPANPNTSGKMDFYEISLSEMPKLSESYDGFGKIVDVSYRE